MLYGVIYKKSMPSMVSREYINNDSYKLTILVPHSLHLHYTWVMHKLNHDTCTLMF